MFIVTDTILWIRRVISELFVERFVLAVFSYEVQSNFIIKSSDGIRIQALLVHGSTRNKKGQFKASKMVGGPQLGGVAAFCFLRFSHEVLLTNQAAKQREKLIRVLTNFLIWKGQEGIAKRLSRPGPDLFFFP